MGLVESCSRKIIWLHNQMKPLKLVLLVCVRRYRLFFAIIGVPTEILNDWGPEFTAESTKSFYYPYQLGHQVSSAHFLSSKSRAELTVKASLDTNEMVCALLTCCKTPVFKISSIWSTTQGYQFNWQSKKLRGVWHLKKETNMKTHYVNTLQYNKQAFKDTTSISYAQN